MARSTKPRATPFTEAQKREIVQRLACFETPRSITVWLKEEFGLDVHPLRVSNYDPTRGGAGNRTTLKWKTLFHEQRAAFLRETSRYAVTHLTWRIATYQRMIDQALDQKNLVLAADLMEQAAKDQGGAFTNKRILEAEPKTALAALLGLSPHDLEETPLPPSRNRLHMLKARGNGNGANPGRN